jgi:hypothetical protein
MKLVAIIGLSLIALGPVLAQQPDKNGATPKTVPTGCPKEINGYWISESSVVLTGSYRITIEKCAGEKIAGKVEFTGLRECRNFNQSFSGDILPGGTYMIRSVPGGDQAACDLEMTIGQKDGRYRLDRYTGRLTSVYR